MSDKIRFIYLIKPISFLIPEVPKPQKIIKTSEKLVWTGMVLFIFLICSQIPLYGIYKTEGSDPLHYMRVILASSRSSLMELGITPIITSSMLMNILVSLKMIDIDRRVQEEVKLCEQTTKLIAMIITIGEATAYVLGGMYGDVNLISFTNRILIIIQLSFAGLMVIILDELLSNGYGMVSGISLFVATNISENIMWKSFSPFTVTSGRGVEYEGAIISIFHFLMTKPNKIQAIKRAFFRKDAPNIISLFSTFLIFFIVVYLRGFKMPIKINSRQKPGEYIVHNIKLFYSSTTPIIMVNTFLTKLNVFTQILYNRYSHSFLIQLLGTWKNVDGEMKSTGGLAYYLSPPQKFSDFIMFPIKSIVYVIFILTVSGLFTKTMVELTGKSARDLARSLKQEGFFLEGIRENEESIYKRLETLIPTASILCGVIIAALNLIGDLLDVVGSGTGILLLVSIIVDFVHSNDKKGIANEIQVLKEE